MATRNEKLNRLTIGSPCSQPWSGMQGDDKRRHCLECDRTVHDLARLTPREIAGLVEASRGHLCGRITRDGAGRLVTGELVPPMPSPTAGSFRASPIAAAVVGGLLALGGGGASGQPPASAVAAAPGAPEPEVEPEGAPQKTAAPAAVLSGGVIDENGAPLPGVRVVARHSFGGQETSAVTDASGRFAFASLDPGAYDLVAELEGFSIPSQTYLPLRSGERREVGLRAAPARGGVSEGGMVVEREPLSRTFEESDLVVLATVGPSVAVDRGERSGQVATELTQLSSLKGKAPGRTLLFHHAEYGSLAERMESLPPGTRVLAFLNARHGDRDDRGGRLAAYESADYHFGLKTDLSADQLEAYAERLTALARLYRHGRPHPANLVEWLVATAEEPLTRQEGVRELQDAVRALEQDADSHGTTPERLAAELSAAVTRFGEGGGSFETETGPALLAALLTDRQKARLSSALQTAPRLTEAELVLFALVRTWAGEDAISWLADRLENAAPEDGGLNLDPLSELAYELEDEELRRLTEAAEDELQAYEDSLDDTEDGDPRVERKSRSIEKALRVLLAQALKAKS